MIILFVFIFIREFEDDIILKFEYLNIFNIKEILQNLFVASLVRCHPKKSNKINIIGFSFVRTAFFVVFALVVINFAQIVQNNLNYIKKTFGMNSFWIWVIMSYSANKIERKIKFASVSLSQSSISEAVTIIFTLILRENAEKGGNFFCFGNNSDLFSFYKQNTYFCSFEFSSLVEQSHFYQRATEFRS